jgi:CelD/BcsL family acetyltransferase involved in cellulose biosynthesis
MTISVSKTLSTGPALVQGQAQTLALVPGRFRMVRDEQEFLALKPFWDRLLERSAVRTPFMFWDWVSLWYENHRDQCKLCIGVLDDARTGEVIAIAPLIIARPTSGARKALRHISFIGAINDDAAQGMDFIVPAGLETQLTPLLCKIFSRNLLSWDVIDLSSMHEESPNLPFIRQALARYAGCGERSAPQNSYLMHLPPTWDEQLAQWKSKERVTFRTKWRKLVEGHNARFLQGGIDIPAEQAFDELWRLHALRFQSQDKHSCFLSESMRNHQRELVKRWSADGRVMLPLIEADGRIVAARYGFAIDGKYWSFQTGYDPDYGKLSVGILSLGWTAQCAIEQGLHEMDHLPGEARYKSEWSTHTRRVVHLEAFNYLSVSAPLFRVVRAIKRKRQAEEDAQAIAEVTT